MFCFQSHILDYSFGVLPPAAFGAWCANPCHCTGEYKLLIFCPLAHPLPHVVWNHSSDFHSEVSDAIFEDTGYEHST